MSLETLEITPWVEKYRPKKFDDVVGNKEIVDMLRDYVKNKNCPHIILYGKQGRGKTTLALVLVNEMFADLEPEAMKRRFQFANASDKRGIDYFRNDVTAFVKESVKLRVLILDEVDNATPDAQLLMRPLMETKTSNCRFVMTCNYIHKIIDPIKDSRCMAFEVKRPTDEEVKSRLAYILTCEKQQIPDEILKTIVVKSDGDLRKAINLTYTYCVSKVLANVESQNGIDGFIKDFTKFSFSGDIENAIIKLQDLLSSHDFKTIIGKIRDKIIQNNKLNKKMRFDLLKLVCECEYRYALGVTDETILAYFMAVSNEIANNTR
jgi:replication factor C small subunit